MPKGASGGKRTQGGGITLQAKSVIGGGFEENEFNLGLSTIGQIENAIKSRSKESVAIFGSDRTLLNITEGQGGEVSLSQSTLNKYKNEIRVMTHNHPIELDLSTGDLIAAARMGAETSHGFEELRAVTQSGKTYRALRPRFGKWPSQEKIESSIQKNIRKSYESAYKARQKGASKEEAFELYQRDLTKRVARNTGIRLKTGKVKNKEFSLFNKTPLLRSPITNKPTSLARSIYGFQGSQGKANIQGEKKGAFPIFDIQSALSGLHLRGHTKTEQGRKNVITRASQYAQNDASRALQRDKNLGAISVSNISQKPLRTASGKPSAYARQIYGSKVSGEKSGSFPIFDVQSAKSALKLRRFAKTETGRIDIIKRAEKHVPLEASIIRGREQERLSKQSRRQSAQVLDTSVRLQNKSFQNLSFRQPPPKSFTRKAIEFPFKAAWGTTKFAARTAGKVVAVPFKIAAYPFKSKTPSMDKLAKQMTKGGLSKDVWKQLTTEQKRWLTKEMKGTKYNKMYREARGLSLRNVSEGKGLSFDQHDLRTASGKPSALARRMYGSKIPGEKPGSFPIFDTQSAKSALKLQRFAKTVQGKADIQTRAAKQLAESISLSNTSQSLRSINTGKPTKLARDIYGFGGSEGKANIKGEKKGSFPIFDTRSAQSAMKLRGHAKTVEGRKNIEERSRKQLSNTITLMNKSAINMKDFEKMNQKNSTETIGYFANNKKVFSTGGDDKFVRVTMSDILKHAHKADVITHNHPSTSSFSTHDFQSVGLQGALNKNFKEMRATTIDGMVHSLKKGKRQSWANSSETGEAIIRSIDSSVNKARQVAFNGKGSYVSDIYQTFQDSLAKSTASKLGYDYTIQKGLHLKKASTSELNINKKKWSTDATVGAHISGISGFNSQQYANTLKRQVSKESNHITHGLAGLTGFAGGAYGGFILGGQTMGTPLGAIGGAIVGGVTGSRIGHEIAYYGNRARNSLRYGKNFKTNELKNKGVSLNNKSITLHNTSFDRPYKSNIGEKAIGVVGGYYGMKYAGKVADFVTPTKGPLKVISAPIKYGSMILGALKGYDIGHKIPSKTKEIYKGVKTGKINKATISKQLNSKNIKTLGKKTLDDMSTISSKGSGLTSFYIKSGINPLSLISKNKEQKAAFWAVNPYTRKIPAITFGIGIGRLGYEVMKNSYSPVTAIIGAGIAAYSGKVVSEAISHKVSKRIAKKYDNTVILKGGGTAYIAASSLFGNGLSRSSKELLREKIINRKNNR